MPLLIRKYIGNIQGSEKAVFFCVRALYIRTHRVCMTESTDVQRYFVLLGFEYIARQRETEEEKESKCVCVYRYAGIFFF